MNKDEKLVIPIRMQLSEPEYMCPKCGVKFYVYNENPEVCSYCKIAFAWDDNKVR